MGLLEKIEKLIEEANSFLYDARLQRRERDIARQMGDANTANFRDNVARLIIAKRKPFNQTMGEVPRDMVKELHNSPRLINRENFLAKSK